jgi:hypothetical protein
MRLSFTTIVLLFFLINGYGQNANRIIVDQCGTMNRLEERLSQNASLRLQFDAQKDLFNKSLKAGRSSNRIAPTNISIPVVFHIVLSNPNIVTNEQIQAQLDTLNKDFFGSNADSAKIPAYFKSFFGKSSIQFCLAQRTPNGELTTGIERVSTNKSSFSTNDEVKHASSGGIESWNTDKYLNIWITVLSNDLLGYASFPNDGSAEEQGVVIDYRALPGGSYTSYNRGRTLVHETGHYFNLYHIWGDDGGSCNGTDYVDDTPNQTNSSRSCFSGIRLDNCTASGNGIMYQNFMDYTPDACMLLFTTEQVMRMETALYTYRSSLLQSDGCQPPVFFNHDVILTNINEPDQRLCNPSFSPEITINNKGLQTLTSLHITVEIDNNTALNYDWVGSVLHSGNTKITLPSINISAGVYSLSITLSNPNGTTDEDRANNFLNKTIQYYPAVAELKEGFEQSDFLPIGWDIVNPDSSITWQKVNGLSKTGNASMMIDNYNYSQIGSKDDLRTHGLTISAGVDSAFLVFNIAAASYTNSAAANNNWDTLEVLVSTDCGASYSSLYRKWGANLITKAIPDTEDFLPAANDWRQDSINLGGYIGKPDLLIAFRNTTGNENRIYLDDVKLRTVTINPYLKNEGFLVTPNPTNGLVAVQFYPTPTNLRSIQLYNISGQKISELAINNGVSNYYSFNLTNYSSGIYFVRAVFSDNVVIKKIIKQ